MRPWGDLGGVAYCCGMHTLGTKGEVAPWRGPAEEMPTWWLWSERIDGGADGLHERLSRRGIRRRQGGGLEEIAGWSWPAALEETT